MSDRLRNTDDSKVGGPGYNVVGQDTAESALTQAQVLADAVRVAASQCPQHLMPASIFRIGADD